MPFFGQDPCNLRLSCVGNACQFQSNTGGCCWISPASVLLWTFAGNAPVVNMSQIEPMQHYTTIPAPIGAGTLYPMMTFPGTNTFERVPLNLSVEEIRAMVKDVIG